MKKLLTFVILILSTNLLFSQSAIQISGKIITEKDNSIVKNAAIVLKDALHFTYSNPIDGTFKLYLNKNSGVIIISAKGFKTVEMPITKDSTDIIVKLIEQPELERIPDNIGGFVGGVDLVRAAKSGDGGFTAEVSLKSSDKRPMPMIEKDMSGFASSIDLDTDLAIKPESEKQAESGLLTAGEVNDFAKWKMWNDIASNDLATYQDIWKAYPFDRFTVQLENENRAPVFGAKVNLLDDGFVVWSAYSDNTGKAELWLNPFDRETTNSTDLKIEIEYLNKYYQIENPKKFSNGINFLRISSACVKPKFADIAFVVDATGSMGDEINYLKMDIQAIMKQISDTLPNLNFNLASVFYRDTTDAYVTKHSDFENDVKLASEFIDKQSANGGGDYPEAVHRGLDVAINQLSWRENSIAKIIFLVLDAPPHTRPEVINEIHALTLKASEKGIRIIPLACSGIDKSTEYFLRSIALLTNGTYTFLTDDSGIGNPHIKPSTDKFDVETLKQVLVRLVYQYSYYPECEAYMPLLVSDTLSVTLPETGGDNQNSLDDIKVFEGFRYFPNPTLGDLNIEFVGTPVELFIADVSGKIIFRLENSNQNRIFIDLSRYPTGVYYLMYQYKPDKWLKGKIVLMH